MTLRVVYRIYGGENRKGRPGYYSKQTSFASLLRAAAYAQAPVVVLADGPLPEDIRSMAQRHATVLHLVGGPVGMRKSFTAGFAVPDGLGWSDEDVVYFCEDDYLHTEDAIAQLRAATRDIPQASYFALYGSTPRHPAHPTASGGTTHVLPEDWRPRSDAEVNGHRWVNIPSTTSTFAVRVAALRADRGIVTQAMVPYPSRYLDHEMFLVFQGCLPYTRSELFLGPEETRFRSGLREFAANVVLTPFRIAFQLRSLTRRRSPHLLYAADPNLASHMENGLLARGVDWEHIAADADAWWAEHAIRGGRA